MRLDITVHDAFAVAEVQGLEQLENVVPYVVVLELGIETPKVGVVDIFENERRCFALHLNHQQFVQQATAGEAQYRAVAHAVFFRITTDLVVAHHIQKRNNVGTARQVLKDLDLALYLLLLDRLQDLDDALLVVDHVDALEHLRVLSAANLADNLVVFKHAPRDVDRVVVPVRAGHVGIDVGIDASNARAAAVGRHLVGGQGGGDSRRRGSDCLGCSDCGAVGDGVEWWGEEAEVGGKQAQTQASKADTQQAERGCLVPGNAPRVLVVAARSWCCNSRLALG